MESEMMEARNTQTRTKSKIAIKRGSSLQNKENIPNNNTSKKGVKKKAVIPPSGRNTLSNRKGNGAEEKPVIKTKRAKDAPDFSKLHKKWETKLAKGKAVTKRANTQIEPFNLTKDVDTKTEETDLNEELLEVDVDDHEQVEILHEGSEIVEKITDAGRSCEKQNSQSKQVPVTPTTHFKVPKSIRRPPVSCAKTKDKRVQFVEDPFEFKPDNNALQSILNNDGIRSTPSKRNTGVYCSPFNQKRTSIYYTGPRPDRPPTAFEKRLSMRRAAAVMAKMKLPEKSFQPSQTLVGVQEIGNKFTAVTSVQDSGNDFNTNDECIPEGASEDERTQCNDTVALVTGSSQHEVESEISWADTLKCYSQSEQENDSTVEDEEALIAQLEEEVRQTLSDIALTGQINPFPPNPACKTEAEIVSIPLQQRRQKPSIYRKLFASPCNVQGGQAMTDRNVLIPQYSHPATSSNVNTPSLPCNSSEVKQGYPKKLLSTLMPESDDFPELPIDSTICSLASEENINNTGERRTRIPLGKGITFSPFVTGGTPECKIAVQKLGMQNRSKIGTSDVCNGKEMSTRLSQQCLKTSASINNYFVKPGNGGVGHSDGTVVNGKFDRTTLHGLQTSCGGNPSVSGSAFVTQNSRLRKNDLQGFRGAALGSLGNVECGFKEKESADDLSLVAAASASLNSKLKQALGTGSKFRMCAPSVHTTEHPTAANSYTQSNEKRILVPTPVKPVVRRGELLHQETGSSQFISRHRQIMRDAMLKSRDHAHELLLDAEVSLYARRDYVRKYDVGLRLVNPVAKLMSEGDEMHFVPVLA